MSRPSHKPVRTCLGCNTRDMQVAMVRIAVRGGVLTIDQDRRGPGRGGYLHRTESCVAKFTRSKVREFRSLRRGIPLDERREIANRITESIQSAAGERPAAEIR